MESRRIVCRGNTIHFVQSGLEAKPCVLFLHGYPDSHRVWIPLMQSLQERFRVVAFDLRGVADSRPAPSGGYRIDELLPDIACVLDATVGHDGKAHLIGHDWGSTIGWSFLTQPQHSRRVLSWQSISGPHLGLWMQWMARGLRSMEIRRTLPVLGQLLRSSYVLFLLAWPLPELFWRLGGVSAWRLVLRAAGVPRGDPMLEETRERILSMALRPMALYRQNLFHPPPTPRPRGIDVPTQLIVPTRDPFVSERVYDDLAEFVADLTVQRVPASHWAQRSHPGEIASCIKDFLERQEARRTR